LCYIFISYSMLYIYNSLTAYGRASSALRASEAPSALPGTAYAAPLLRRVFGHESRPLCKHRSALMTEIPANCCLSDDARSLHAFDELLLQDHIDNHQRQHDEDDTRIHVKLEDVGVVDPVYISDRAGQRCDAL